MINVLQVVPTLGYGGVAKVVKNYYEAIDHDKYHFDFVTHGGVEDYHAGLVDLGSKIYYFNTIGKIGLKKYSRQITSSMDLSTYDIVHIHTGDITGIYAKIYRKSGAKKIICHAHTTRAVSRSHKLFEGFLRKMALRYADMTMACGYEAGDYCFGKDNYILLPNSIDFESFNRINSEQINNVKKELHIADDAYVIGHIGLFSPVKNHSFLLSVAKEFISKHKNTVFVLCGNGPLFDSIKEAVDHNGLNDNVILTGIRNDVNVLMHLFDVFVLPSLHEGLPMVGIEAQTAGLNCLLSDQIDHRVDIGCNLCTFLPIDKGTGAWVNALETAYSNQNNIVGKDIKTALKNHGYDISSTRDILTKSYESLV